MSLFPSLLGLVRKSIYPALGAALAVSAVAEPEIVFEADFHDPSLPVWQTRWNGATVTTGVEADGAPSLTIQAEKPVNPSAVATLPVEKLAGRVVIVDAMIRAENVEVGKQPYHRGKLIMRWEAAEPGWSKGNQSDFAGTFPWMRKRYAVQIPSDATEVSLRIGIEQTTGTASFSNLKVYTDPRIQTLADFERVNQQDSEETIAALLKDGSPELKLSEGGAAEVFVGDTRIPRSLWTDAIRKKLMDTPEPPVADGDSLAAVLSRAFRDEAAALTEGYAALEGQAANDRAVEIAGLRLRATLLAENPEPGEAVTLSLSGQAIPAPAYVLGNNINWGEFDMITDKESGKLAPEFKELVEPMGVTFLRYPGGCNADVFDWREAIGPMNERAVQTYYNRGHAAPVFFGVDEFLQFCERHGITPILTTAFLKDSPSALVDDPAWTGQKAWVADYLKTAPERVQLAADWVEYCNGSVDTPMGALRAKNGHPEPYNVIYWEVGNETFGPDPVGSTTVEEYAEAFPRYVEAMKARDPGIQIALNGHRHGDWMEKVIRIGGEHADFLQFHIYVDGGSPVKEPSQQELGTITKSADGVNPHIERTVELMHEHLGKSLPIALTEYGIGSRASPQILTSMAGAVAIGDMLRNYLDHPEVFGANRWCLYQNFWFTSICGPNRGEDRPFRVRPDWGVFAAFAAARGDSRFPVEGTTDDVQAVVFDQVEHYGVVLIHRGTEAFANVTLDFPGLTTGTSRLLLQTTAHALTSTENDHDLATLIDTSFNFSPDESLPLPPHSVLALILPKTQTP